jgi:tRNA-2-methylthio-N6-dimethylallyladenosine synthase
MKYLIKTFGCQLNFADSERVASSLEARGMKPAKSYTEADHVVINTCMVRQSAENRVYGLINNLRKVKSQKSKIKIILTGCMVGLAFREKTGKYLHRLKIIMPQVDEFLPIEEVGFDNAPLRTDKISAWVPISNGCNNFCSFCVVPFTRGRETSRPYEDIIRECQQLKELGYKNITLLGQNVNSYGADFFKNSKFQFPISKQTSNFKSQISKHKPIYVKHLGRLRIPTLFPYLLEEVARMYFEKIDFMSSNPWDFSDELTEVIARNKNITRTIHLPVQSGDDNVLKRMNRWYSAADYVGLISKIKNQISNIKFTTDIIVGFCGETDEEFENTVKLCKKVGFEKAYISMYSPRPMTAASKTLKDDISYNIKKNRWQILEDLINKPKSKKKKT